MARRRGRGGYQRPSNPAAVSGPGALSQRTDGGPSMEYSGLPYGENQAVNDQMAALPTGGPPQGGGGGAMMPSIPNGGIFGETARPDEPMTAGMGNVGLSPDPDMMIRALAEASRSITSNGDVHPDLMRLMDRVQRQ